MFACKAAMPATRHTPPHACTVVRGLDTCHTPNCTVPSADPGIALVRCDAAALAVGDGWAPAGADVPLAVGVASAVPLPCELAGVAAGALPLTLAPTPAVAATPPPPLPANGAPRWAARMEASSLAYVPHDADPPSEAPKGDAPGADIGGAAIGAPPYGGANGALLATAGYVSMQRNATQRTKGTRKQQTPRETHPWGAAYAGGGGGG